MVLSVPNGSDGAGMTLIVKAGTREGAPSMGFLLESLSMLCSCVPLIDKQAIEDPIHILAMKPIRLTENPLLSKTESLGDCACYLSHRRSRLYATHAPRTRASPSF